VSNPGKVPVDVTILFVDSGYGISAVFPQRGMIEDNRLPPGKTLRTQRFSVTDATLGLEHAVLLAVKGEGAAADFSYLEQSALPTERTRGAAAANHPLGRFLADALRQQGTTRGLAAQQAETYLAKSLSWRVKP
jgi:hypothetical protein